MVKKKKKTAGRKPLPDEERRLRLNARVLPKTLAALRRFGTRYDSVGKGVDTIVKEWLAFRRKK